MSDGATTANPSVDALNERFGDAVQRSLITTAGQDVVYVNPAQNVKVLSWLKDDPDHRYDLLVDVTAVDHGGGSPIEVVYQLWSIPHKRALRVKCELPLEALEIASVVSLWQSADWLEREVFDLFGVTFTGHPDLRRILMPDNYEEGYPLRKDFPLRGRFSRAEQTRRALIEGQEHDFGAKELDVVGAAEVPDQVEPATGSEPA